MTRCDLQFAQQKTGVTSGMWEETEGHVGMWWLPETIGQPRPKARQVKVDSGFPGSAGSRGVFALLAACKLQSISHWKLETWEEFITAPTGPQIRILVWILKVSRAQKTIKKQNTAISIGEKCPPRISWPFFLGGFPEARPVAEEREVVEPWHPETAHPIGSLESWTRFMNHNHPLRKSQAAEAEDPWSTGWPFPVFMSMMARFVFCVLRTCCVARSWSMVDRPPRKCSKSRIFRCFWKNSGGIRWVLPNSWGWEKAWKSGG